MNPLMPLSHHDGPSKTPAAKSVPVRIRASGERGDVTDRREPPGHTTHPV
jgi:hypothetical protein